MVSISHFIHGGIKSDSYKEHVDENRYSILEAFERIKTDIAVKGLLSTEIIYDELVKSHQIDGKVKSSYARHANLEKRDVLIATSQ